MATVTMATWTLACGRGSYLQARATYLQQQIEAKTGVPFGEAKKVAKRDRSGILRSYVAPQTEDYIQRVPKAVGEYLWLAYAWYLKQPWRVNTAFLNTLGGLVVKMKDGRVYLILRTALPVNDAYKLTNLVYRILKNPDVEFVDRIRGASYERDASIIRTPSELYAWLATPDRLPSAPTMPALMLPQHLVRELEEFANLQIDLMRKQVVNLEYLFNIRARRLAARLRHQLEAELQAIRNRLREYETEFQNTVNQAKVGIATAQVTPEYIHQLEEYVKQAKRKIQERVDALSKELKKLTERIITITERTTTQEPPPPAPYRPDRWPATKTTAPQGVTPVSQLDPKLLLLGAGGIAALWYFLRR